MTDHGARVIVFLHGAGGPDSQSEWLSALDHAMTGAGQSRIDPGFDQIIAPSYLEALEAEGPASEPARVWRRPSDREFVTQRAEYTERLDWHWQRLRHLREDTPSVSVPDGPHVPLITDLLVPPASRYRANEAARWRAQRAVLDALPGQGTVIVIAHSLGSVLAWDLLPKLPPALKVNLLLTIGSPLWSEEFGRDPGDDFPYDRVGAWVNLYNPRDFVTSGQGIGGRHRQAVDVVVGAATAHGAAVYLRTRAAGMAVGLALHGEAHSTVLNPNAPARRLHPYWYPTLLGAAFAQQLSNSCHSSDWGWRTRLDTARTVVAERTLQDIEAARQAVRLGHASRVPEPVEAGRHPDKNDLVHTPSEAVGGCLADEGLLLVAIQLMLASPVPPFDIEISDDHRHIALRRTLNLVRRGHRQAAVSDEEFADAVRAGVREARQVLDESDGWAPVLAGLGLVALAATGVGLALAVPAGLAGAAAITATLAAFGPGGMVGGIATLAVLTGTGSTILGVAAGRVGAGDDAAGARALRDSAVQQLAEMPSDQLRTVLASSIALLEAQRRLGHTSSALELDQAFQAAIDELSAERRVHQRLAPGRPGTSDLGKRVELLQRGRDWIRRSCMTEEPVLKARGSAVKLLT